MIIHIIEATSKLKQAYVDEEAYLKQKNRNRWFQEGDKNIKFFHAQTKQQKTENKIVGLTNSNGEWVINEEDILAEASKYFSELFTSKSTTNIQLDEVETIIDFDNHMLTCIATEEEVKAALFLMNHGITSFFQNK